jgi:hypothetical protein
MQRLSTLKASPNEERPDVPEDVDDYDESEMNDHLDRWREWQKTRDALSTTWSAFVREDWATFGAKLSATGKMSFYERITSKIVELEAERQRLLTLSEDDWSKPEGTKSIHTFFVDATIQAARVEYWPAEFREPGFETIEGKKNLHSDMLRDIGLDKEKWEDVWPLEPFIALQWTATRTAN